jgi:ADP-heptose:LPS heptosyltransferase
MERPVGFQWAQKWLRDDWPEQLLLDVVNGLPSDSKIFVAPEERERAEELLPGPRRDNLVCCPELLAYAREVGRCRYLISVDTGAVHVAAAMGVPVVDVFPEAGSHHTVPRWRPWMTPHRVVLKPVYSKGATSVLIDKIEQASGELDEILRGLAAS